MLDLTEPKVTGSPAYTRKLSAEKAKLQRQVAKLPKKESRAGKIH